uniref:Uncharacterized protein n=1 Tax=Cannabis sativa TaxID=3483 RepID=A0A803NSY2_CANSA
MTLSYLWMALKLIDTQLVRLLTSLLVARGTWSLSCKSLVEDLGKQILEIPRIPSPHPNQLIWKGNVGITVVVVNRSDNFWAFKVQQLKSFLYFGSKMSCGSACSSVGKAKFFKALGQPPQATSVVLQPSQALVTSSISFSPDLEFSKTLGNHHRPPQRFFDNPQATSTVSPSRCSREL